MKKERGSMAKFQKIQITQVVAEGFKGFKEKTVITFDKGKNVFIGDNGLGKSSIGELIAWVFTGKNIQGKQKDLNIIHKDCSSAYGSVSFIDERGEVHEVERKLNSTTTIKFDQKRVAQKQLEEMIPTEMFLLIFNPLYFLSMDAEASRKTIYSLLPGVKKEEVLAELKPHEREFLEKENFDIEHTNDYLVSRRKELKEVEDRKKHLQGYMEKLQEKIDIPAPMTFDESKIKAVEEQLEALNQRKPALKNLSELLIKKSELDKKISEIKSQKFESEKLKLELQKEKALIEQQLKAEMEKQYQPMDTSKLETKIAVLRNEYKMVNAQYKTLEQEIQALDKKQVHFHEGDQCPLCKQIITANAVKVLNEELKKQVNEEKAKIVEQQKHHQKTLADLEKEGKALLAEITKAKQQDEQLRTKFEEEKEKKIQALKSRLKEIEKELNRLEKLEADFEKEKQEKIQELMKQIQALEIDKLEEENAKIQKAFEEEIQKERQSLLNTLSALRKEKEAVLQHEAHRMTLLKRAEENQKELEKKKQELASYEKQEAHIQNQISYMKLFNAQKIAMVNRQLSKYLKNVSLKLEKTIQSTGEIKDCFEVLYDGKELKVCSTSETIKAGLEISHMISQLCGLDYPVFVDNGESVTSYEETASQIIETKVVKDKKLSVVKDGKEVEISTIPLFPKSKMIIRSVSNKEVAS
jgi:DNA repair exonuclease SbcCD ATPase subunit